MDKASVEMTEYSSLGEVCYAAHLDSLEEQGENRQLFIPWAELAPVFQQAWEAAAYAIASVFKSVASDLERMKAAHEFLDGMAAPVEGQEGGETDH